MPTPNAPLQPAVIGLPDLAVILGSAPRTVEQLLSKGQLPRPFRIGRRRVWLRRDIEVFLEDAARAART
jgi:predicted DNA-binding transcriptional regulator AlpA